MEAPDIFGGFFSTLPIAALIKLPKIRFSAVPLFWFFLCIVLIAVMLPGLNGGFLFDDLPNIVDNQAVHITSLNLDALRHSLSGPNAGPSGRPVSVLSFALTHYVFGLDAYAFKAINLAIHAFNGLLVAWVIARLLRSPDNAGRTVQERPLLACWVAAAWLLHPINVVPILLAVQRMTLLSAMFLLLALICHLQAVDNISGKRTKLAWLGAGWLIFWPLSILSKETGALLPVYVLVIHCTVRPLPDLRVRHKVALAGGILALGAMALFLSRHWLADIYALRAFTLTERLMTEMRVLWFYAAQIVLPNPSAFGFYLDDFGISTGIASPATTSFAIIGWAAIVTAVLYGKRRYPIPSLAVAWFLGGHLLESTVLPLEIAQEYRNYLPSIGLILGAGYLGSNLLNRAKLDHRALTIGMAAVAPVFVLALLTWLRASQLGDPVIGPQIEVARHPQSARANQSAALALIKTGHGNGDDLIGGELVRYHLERAHATNSSFKAPSLQLIFWACASGRPVDKAWTEGLATRLEHTAFEPGDFQMADHLLEQTLAQPRCLSRDEVIRLLLAGAHNTGIAGSLRAGFLEAAADYVLLVARDPVKARDYLTQATALWPENPALRKKLESFQAMPVEASVKH
jgi:protein O-mannosyl-transferase